VWAIGVIILVLMMGLNAQLALVIWQAVICFAFTGTEVLAAAKPGMILAIKRIGPHSKEALSLLVGGLLFFNSKHCVFRIKKDMWGVKIAGKFLNSVRFGLEQSTKNTAYLHSVWQHLCHLGYAWDTSLPLFPPIGWEQVQSGPYEKYRF
jgi:hypothetical protein